jgi:hypothetical protein
MSYRHAQKRISLHYSVVKLPKVEKKEGILKITTKKCQVTYTGKHIRRKADLSAGCLKSRDAWNDIFQALEENNCQSRLLYLLTVSYRIEGT